MRLTCIWLGNFLPQRIANHHNIKYYDEDTSSIVAQECYVKGILDNKAEIHIFSVISDISRLLIKRLSGKQYGIFYNAILVSKFLFLNRLAKLFFYKIACKQLILKNDLNSNKLIVFVYGVGSGGCRAAGILKTLFPQITTVLIVLDAPEFMTPKPGNLLKLILKKIDRKIIDQYLYKFDKYIVVTEHLINYLHIDKRKTLVIEGMYGDKINISKLYKHTDNKIILYAGSLYDEKSMKTIINAFLVSGCKGVEFHIYGFASHSFEQYLLKISQQYTNIKYLGFCRDRYQLLKLESEADLLLMLRDPDLEYTKYSFPSKLFELMASGTPVLTSRLDGIAAEYYQYLFTVEKFNEKEIANNIKKIFNMPSSELSSLGHKAQMFIKNNKIPEIQVKKALKFVVGDDKNV